MILLKVLYYNLPFKPGDPKMRMKLISVKLPEVYLEGIEELVKTGFYPNRSEAIRVAIRDLLKRELWEKQRNISMEEERGEKFSAIVKKALLEEV